MTTLSTHVLDAVAGRPAAGLAVTLIGPQGPIGADVTDHDGRIRWAGELDGGDYALRFDTGAWFAAASRATFYSRVELNVSLDGEHVHVALLLSPYSYTTYKGS